MGEFETSVWDSDYLVYACGFAGEKRTIKVVHKQSGDEFDFANRTAFYGAGKGKNKGWIGETNKTRDIPYVVDEFEIFDLQHAEPIENVLHTVKTKVESVNKILGTKKMIAYHGAGPSFRVDRSTIIGYKMNRDNTLKPVHKESIIEYLEKKYKSIPCIGLEADDWTNIMGQNKKVVTVSHDKDSLGNPVYTFNPAKPDEGVVDGRGFGSLWLKEKTNAKGVTTRDVKGIGRKFFYYQLVYGDSVDNYYANSATEQQWGEISAYNMLKDATNDKEALAAVVATYKNLYPEPKRIIGWRGDEIEVDWKYVLSENWEMARMLRSPDEKLYAEEVFTKFGLWKD